MLQISSLDAINLGDYYAHILTAVYILVSRGGFLISDLPRAVELLRLYRAPIREVLLLLLPRVPCYRVFVMLTRIRGGVMHRPRARRFLCMRRRRIGGRASIISREMNINERETVRS